MIKKITAFFSSILMLFGCSNAHSNNTDSTSNERAGLIDRLKSLANEDDGLETPALPIEENAMCYEPAIAIHHISCVQCEHLVEVLSDYYETLDDMVNSLQKYDYEANITTLCYDCLKKLVEEKQIETDFEEGEELQHACPVLNIRKVGEESFRRVLLKHEDYLTTFVEHLETDGKRENYYTDRKKSIIRFVSGEDLVK